MTCLDIGGSQVFLSFMEVSLHVLSMNQRFSLTHRGDHLRSNSLCPPRSQDQMSLGPAAPLVGDVIRTIEVGLLFWIQNLKQFLYFGIHLFLYSCWFHMFNFSGYSPSFSVVFLCILHRGLCFSSSLSIPFISICSNSS